MCKVIPFKERKDPLELTDKEKERIQILKTAQEYAAEKQREEAERKKRNDRTTKEYRLK